jgi:hypothetical protein
MVEMCCRDLRWSCRRSFEIDAWRSQIAARFDHFGEESERELTEATQQVAAFAQGVA